jgi:DNA repair exonuclease SbcCD ATPase subunit
MLQMNSKIYQSALASLLLVIFSCGPVFAAQAASDKTTMQDVKKEMAEAAETIKHYSADQRDEALKKAKAVMEDLDARIDRLETSIHKQWGAMDKAARRKAQAALDKLKQQRKQMAESYNALQQSSAGAWEHVKKGFADSYTDLQDAWQKAEKEFDGGK